MKFQLALVALLPLVYSLPTAEPAPEAAVSDASPAALFKRACSYANNCYSATGISAGKYCGFCKQVLGSYAGDHPAYIYQVNGKSSGDSCCSYGASGSCAAKWPSVNGNLFVNCKNTDKGY
ncbi:hypothetical protein VTL71DRAFT_13517 [Oculimacula yallundae]|uniref:Uncharacterized protein n=1 Tax=Oculimacula yallundae TaxID=86028 RepID=A0ABR4CM86_9HELO